MKKILEFYEKIKIFLKEVKVEMMKVTWPSKQQIVNYTIVVIVGVFILSAIIGLEDRILGWFLSIFLNL
jgi:preprotein translocase subunit SecE